MRVPREIYDTLKRLEANEGFTREITIQQMDALIDGGFVEPHESRFKGEYRFQLTARAKAALTDRPIDHPGRTIRETD